MKSSLFNSFIFFWRQGFYFSYWFIFMHRKNNAAKSGMCLAL